MKNNAYLFKGKTQPYMRGKTIYLFKETQPYIKGKTMHIYLKKHSPI